MSLIELSVVLNLTRPEIALFGLCSVLNSLHHARLNLISKAIVSAFCGSFQSEKESRVGSLSPFLTSAFTFESKAAGSQTLEINFFIKSEDNHQINKLMIADA